MKYLVSGLPRSGTSMMMQILQAGGMKLATDDVREPDEHNPQGYFEISDIISKIIADENYLNQFDDKVVKLIAMGLLYIPKGEYKIIYMERDYANIIKSMTKMGVTMSGGELGRLEYLSKSRGFNMLFLKYDDRKSLKFVDDICKFMELPLNKDKMRGVVK